MANALFHLMASHGYQVWYPREVGGLEGSFGGGHEEGASLPMSERIEKVMGIITDLECRERQTLIWSALEEKAGQ